MSVKRGGGGQNNEKGNDVRECHAQIGMQMDAPELLLRLGWRMLQWLLPMIIPYLFNLLRGLPEKKVRADSCTQHGYQGGQVLFCWLKMREHGRMKDCLP